MSRTAQQPIHSGFGQHTPVSEVMTGIDLTDQVAVVTGGYSGIGVATTRALAAAGATVIVPVRNRLKARQTLADVPGDVVIVDMDLSELASVRACAKQIADTYGEIHILINNAGVMACPEARLGDGWESQFATNHLGHFVFTMGLLPSLKTANGARVVCLSSTAHRSSPIRFDDLHFTKEPYNKWKAYGQSKTANALFAVELDKRFADDGIQAFAVHPGGIQTPLQRHLPIEEMVAMGWCTPEGELTEQAKGMFKSVEAGAATAVWCATSPQLHGMGGVYCEDCDIAEAATEASLPYAHVRAWAVDPEAAARLWTVTEGLVGA